ncbi:MULTISPECIES: NUMOD4 domain-containing protein [Staphylococcus]|uniref:NUMOD4 domain-containing protein n=1 Tax=Staphylococcus TaxID=1279 RepID=UPI001AEC4017|nr:NUMOD4 domain-containing protein [Staphylococcus sp. GDY8P120P]
MKEIWKDVVGYEGIYEISDHGRVRTHKDKTTHSVKHGLRKWKQRMLKDKTPNGRDVRVTLWKDKTPKSYLVHRLVAFTFIPTVKDKNCVNHIDGNPKNNHVDNLEWCTYKENQNHAFENDLMRTNLKVKLIQIKTGIQLEFISMARADKWLERATGYTSGRLKKGYNILNAKDGNEYKVEKLI